ncbi:MAG: aminotransferase class I/II-fold pyridoxal phosphate-dependent enzyme [Phycisphaerales bacterium]
MNAIRSARLLALPPFLFDEIDRKKRERLAAGADVINLGVGDPDQPTPGFIVEEMNRAMRDLVNQQYPAVGGGLKVFREAAARFMHTRFGVTVDPMRHIVALLGSKDGIAHLPLGITNPGDTIIVPDPAYPVYEIGAVLAECRVAKSPVRRETGWKPTFAAPGGAMEGVDVARLKREGSRARLLWVNYPSNPCSSSADVAFYERVIEFCAGAATITGAPLIAASDLAYSELYLDGPANKPPSIWQARNASIDETPAIEFHSLSKTFNMTGWRIGFAVGHADVVGALNTVKSNMDSGTFNAIQAAGALALDRHDGPEVQRMRTLYRDRRDALVPGLRAIGCEVDVPDAGFFVWARTPTGSDGSRVDSMTFAAKCLEQADVVVVPGGGFSPAGREYFRVALTVDSPRLREATQRMRTIEW